MPDRGTVGRVLGMVVACGVAVVLASWCGAVESKERVGVVSHVTVVSDKTEDVTSLEAWKRSFIKPGMTEQQKAMAVWEAVVRYRHQDNPPNEFINNEGHPHDPIKDFNVYGYGQCCCASANVQALARYAGLPARGWGLAAHSVPEVQWDGKWHMLDGSLITYFPKADGTPAAVSDIIASISQWLAAHPELKGNDGKLRKFMRDGGWKNGPELLTSCPAYDHNGWLPAATHGWYSTMQEYGDPKKTFVYEYGTALGYEVNVQLRRGERLTRNWSNIGLHVNALEGGKAGSLKGVVGEDQLRYSPKHGDLAPGRIGNGTLEYDVPLADGGFRGGALRAENLAGQKEDGKAPAAHVQDGSKSGVLEIRMPCSYVYLSGQLSAKAVVPTRGEIIVAFSDNNGLDWKEVARITASGDQAIDLKPLVYRRYDYRVRLTMKGAGTGLESLRLSHDIQHSQRALPALAQGDNTIPAGEGEQLGTITVEGSTNARYAGKNLLLADFHAEMRGVEGVPLHLSGGTGDITLPVSTPGDLKRLRVGAHYRARDAKDGWDVQASFDGGKTWKGIGRLAGPTAGNSEYLVFGDVPSGSRSALVRLAGQQKGTLVLFDLRVSADYVEPQGGGAPVKITYVWTENGSEKRDSHVIGVESETYTIHCAQKPLLKSLIVERAD